MIKLKLDEIADLTNIVPKLNDDEKAEVVNKVLERFAEDQGSLNEWTDRAEKVMKLAGLEGGVLKQSPYKDSSDVKFPLITNAAIQFASRTMPEIVRGNKVVEVSANGFDLDGMIAQRANRVAEFMSYQLIIQDDSWQESMDKTLHLLAVVGQVFRKIYFNPIKGEYSYTICDPLSIFVSNQIQTLNDAPAISHEFLMCKNDIISNVRSGIFDDVDTDLLQSNNYENDTLHKILEQHTTLDLDGDGYEEPYIVTIHLPSNTLLRVVSRYFKTDIHRNNKNEIIYIKPQNFFISYKFLPSLDGTFYGIGYGTLLFCLNWSVNRILNNLIDAGNLANLQTGIIGKGLRLKKGNIKLHPGELMCLDSAPGAKIKDNVVPFEFKEPSATLFSLLGLLVDVSKNLSSTTDLLQGNQLAQNAPATSVLALIEQGTKVFSAIQKRLFTALKREFEIIYNLNKVFVDPNQYAAVLNLPVEEVVDEEGFVKDFEDLSFDIKPVADPTISSDAQRLAQNQAILDLAMRGAIPMQPAIARYLEGLRIPNFEQLLPQGDPGPTIEEQELQLKAEKEQANFDIRRQSLQLKAADQELKRVQVESQAIKAIAEAEAAEAGTQIDAYRAEIEDIKGTSNAISKLRGDNGQNRSGDVERKSSDGEAKKSS